MSSQPSKILIVDDESIVRETLRLVLASEGYEILFADNGEAGLRLARSNRPDVILLDLMMPALDGYEVCRRLRSDPDLAEVPIIVISALDDREARIEALNAGAEDVVWKPFDLLELRAKLRTLTRLNRYRLLSLERQKTASLSAEIGEAHNAAIGAEPRKSGARDSAVEGQCQQVADRTAHWRAVLPDLLACDYRPANPLVTPAHEIDRPRFPVVDAHNHLDLLGPKATEVADDLVATMDESGVRTIVNLSGGSGDAIRRLIDLVDARHPGRFVTFANVDWSRIGEPGFGEFAARQLADAVRSGARGLKIFKELGLVYRDRVGKLVRPDDERLDPLWQTAGELSVPVLIHVADPVAFFDPLDATNDSFVELARHPDWHFHGGDYPAFRELIEAGIRLMSRHPETTFITAHVGWYSENLRFVGERILDVLPNVYTDFSARLRWLAPQPHSARDFFLRYQDRILFGTDHRPTVATYRHYYRYLETNDEGFDGRPGDFLSRGCGISLPDEVLEKVYSRNAARVIPGIA